ILYKGDYMKNIEKYILIFLVGGFGYGLLEILFRGFTHWSMIITGGSALLILYLINLALPNTPTILKAFIGALSITIIEFSVGIIVNKVFSFGVWDYTGSPGNILGIITPSFSLIWFMISLIMISVFKNIQRIISLQKS
ncbi:MAG: hypothetical protein IIX45_10740, partial [Lachnospiraceae bacterium]|nr:hypothetical protein [Lachnospiraceae bacterium]